MIISAQTKTRTKIEQKKMGKIANAETIFNIDRKNIPSWRGNGGRGVRRPTHERRDFRTEPYEDA